MKTLRLIILLLAVATTSIAQNVYKFETRDIKISVKKDGYFQAWGNLEWEDCEVAVTIILNGDNFTGGKIKIYSKETQYFDIVKYIQEHEDEKATTTQLVCEDSDGVTCRISIAKFKDDDIYDEIRVYYSDMRYRYTIVRK